MALLSGKHEAAAATGPVTVWVSYGGDPTRLTGECVDDIRREAVTEFPALSHCKRLDLDVFVYDENGAAVTLNPKQSLDVYVQRDLFVQVRPEAKERHRQAQASAFRVPDLPAMAVATASAAAAAAASAVTVWVSYGGDKTQLTGKNVDDICREAVAEFPALSHYKRLDLELCLNADDAPLAAGLELRDPMFTCAHDWTHPLVVRVRPEAKERHRQAQESSRKRGRDDSSTADDRPAKASKTNASTSPSSITTEQYVAKFIEYNGVESHTLLPTVEGFDTAHAQYFDVANEAELVAKVVANTAERVAGCGLWLMDTQQKEIYPGKRPDLTIAAVPRHLANDKARANYFRAAIQVPERIHPLIVTHIEYKFGQASLDSQSSLGQIMLYLALLLEKQPARSMAIGALANEIGWRAVRVTRTSTGFSGEYSCMVLYADEGSGTFALAALVQSPLATLGYVAALHDLPDPWKLGRYLGRGATASVYELSNGREHYALKILSPALAPAERTAQLKAFRALPDDVCNVNSIAVASDTRGAAAGDASSDGQGAPLQLDGLADWLSARPWALVLSPVTESLTDADFADDALMLQAASILDRLHDKGIAHRDVRRPNWGIVRPHRRIVLLDFGFSGDINVAAPFRSALVYESDAVLEQVMLHASEQPGGRFDVEVSAQDDNESFCKVVYAARKPFMEHLLNGIRVSASSLRDKARIAQNFWEGKLPIFEPGMTCQEMLTATLKYMRAIRRTACVRSRSSLEREHGDEQ